MKNEIEIGAKYATGSQAITGPSAVYKDMQVTLNVPKGHMALVTAWIDLRGTPGGNTRVDLFVDGKGGELAFVYKQDALVSPASTQIRLPAGKRTVSVMASGASGSVESASLAWIIAPSGTGNS